MEPWPGVDRTTAGGDTHVEGMRRGGRGDIRGGGWEEVREDKEMGRKVLTSTDFTPQSGGGNGHGSEKHRPQDCDTATPHPCGLASPTRSLPALSRPTPRACHSLTPPPDPDGAAAGQREAVQNLAWGPFSG